MILEAITLKDGKLYLSVLESYRKMRQDFLDYASTFADYSDVYGILSESTIYKKRKIYEVSVDGQSFLFESPLWFDWTQRTMLKRYEIVGNEFHSFYLHIVWNRDERYYLRNLRK